MAHEGWVEERYVSGRYVRDLAPARERLQARAEPSEWAPCLLQVLEYLERCRQQREGLARGADEDDRAGDASRHDPRHTSDEGGAMPCE